MNIAVIGAGYVGLITAAGFAEKGHRVFCVDIDKRKIELINEKKAPIYEKGLQEILENRVGKNLFATLNLSEAILNSDVTFICVGTPTDKDGSSDLKYVKKVSADIAKNLKEKTYHVVVVKSTVVPGTTENIVKPIIEKISGKICKKDFGLVMNPEFLREGIALDDFLKPDRIVIGSIDKKSGDIVEDLYKDFNSKIFRTDIKTAEMIKYASNAFLATKISFINEIGNICKKLGIDTYEVAKGISLDHRISPYFLNAGLGFGGSCFPKDLKALIHEAKKVNYNPELLSSVMKVNSKQPYKLIELAKKKVKNFSGKKVAVLGLAFKADTDDIRESQSIPVIKILLKEKAKISAYDPKAMVNMKKIFSNIQYANSAEEALKDADIALILTDWKEFENLDFSVMKNKIVVDGRNIVRNKEGIDYEGLAW
ncbi:MAG: UDP-glucose/GDP-mannose dehydrogenase family protein [Candidatus Altiarchaeota archaeon]